MKTFRVVVGSIGGALMILTGAAHSLLGWSELRASFVRAHVPAALVEGLAVPWHLAGVSMVVLGAIALWHFASRSSGAVAPALMIGASYALFGVAGVVFIRPDPIFAAFFVPGAMVFVGAVRPRDAQR